MLRLFSTKRRTAQKDKKNNSSSSSNSNNTRTDNVQLNVYTSADIHVDSSNNSGSGARPRRRGSILNFEPTITLEPPRHHHSHGSASSARSIRSQSGRRGNGSKNSGSSSSVLRWLFVKPNWGKFLSMQATFQPPPAQTHYSAAQARRPMRRAAVSARSLRSNAVGDGYALSRSSTLAPGGSGGGGGGTVFEPDDSLAALRERCPGLSESGLLVVDSMLKRAATVCLIRDGELHHVTDDDLEAMIGSVAADIVGQPAAYFRSLSLKDVAFTEHYGRVISRLLQASDVVDVRQLAIARSVMVLASVKRLFKPLAGSDDGAALVSLSITQCNFGDRSVEYLASALVRGALPLLARLDLSQNVITHDGLAKLVLPEHGLRSRWRLAELNLANNAIGAVGAQHLATMLSTRPLGGTSQLRLLDISSNVVGEPGLRALWQPLASHRSLKNVVLDGNDLGIPGAEHVASLLRHNTAIVSLSLGRNDLRDQGVERIVNALCQQPKQQQQIQQQPLTSLSLDLNGLTATAGQHIGRLLQSPHHRLRSLNLAYNRLQCVGCQHMADGLRSNSTLETLDLAANHIAADGARHIASSLRHAVRNGVSSGSGSGLQNINLGSNSRILDDGHAALAAAIQHNISLTAIQLDFNFEQSGAVYESIQAVTTRNILRSRDRMVVSCQILMAARVIFHAMPRDTAAAGLSIAMLPAELKELILAKLDTRRSLGERHLYKLFDYAATRPVSDSLYAISPIDDVAAETIAVAAEQRRRSSLELARFESADTVVATSPALSAKSVSLAPPQPQPLSIDKNTFLRSVFGRGYQPLTNARPFDNIFTSRPLNRL